ncbi:MAG: DUF3500 domain-containing protein [Litorilinea sp.]
MASHHSEHPLDPRLGAGAANVVQRMGEAAEDFLASLTADQKAKTVFAIDQEAKRTFWHYTPIDRDGLTLNEMEPHQRQLALRLVATGLSHQGYVTASTIMGLETTLDFLEGGKSPWQRDSRRYYVRIFASPSADAPWGWSFEGHHISLNFTIAGGKIIAPTPTFFGANPAEATLGGVSTLRPLQGIEDLAREFVHLLNTDQRAGAIIAQSAPPDIVMTNRAYMEDGALLNSDEEAAQWQAAHNVSATELEALRFHTAHPQGVSTATLQPGQEELLLQLIGEYIHRMPDELAEIELAKLQHNGEAPIHFAWAGGIERHQPHYYRIQAEHFLVEYDNTQNNANHIHSVWRSPHDDFGANILARHYAHSH